MAGRHLGGRASDSRRRRAASYSRKWLTLIIACAALLTGCHSGAQPGTVPPAFALTTSDGQHVSLSSYHGKVLVLNFWATWCPPCVEEVPSLNALQKQLASRNVEVLGVSIDKDAGAYRKFLTDYHIAFATALDPSAAIAHSYRTFKVPETYVINRNGIVARKIVGETDWTSSEMVDYLTDLARGS